MAPQRFGCPNGTTAHPPVRRWHKGWDRMWGEIAKAYGDAACVHDGEAWQYMGTFSEGDEPAVHEFRHRSLPPSGARTLHHVQADASDWENAREPTAGFGHHSTADDLLEWHL